MTDTVDLLTALDQFHFLRPAWLLAIVPALLLAWLMYRRRLHEGAWQRVISPHLLPFLLEGYTGSTQRTPLALLAAGWIIVCVALAGPTWRTLPQPVQKQLHAQVLVFDLSLSMYADDLKPSRLERARFKLRDILDQSEESLTGLIVFAGSSHVVTPLTDDTNTIINMINGLSPDIMPIKGSNPLEALESARDLMTQAGISDGHIILMTDDLDADFTARAQQVVDTQRMPVSILALGTTDGAPIRLPDGNLLKSAQGAIVVPGTPIGRMRDAAQQLGGRFASLSADNSDIDRILALRTAILDNQGSGNEREFDVWHEAGPLLVLLLLPFAAAGYRRGWLGCAAFLLVGSLSTQPTVAQANTWEDLWQTPDQQGQQAWQRGDFEQAEERFKDPAWKGSAAYRAGDYAEAARWYSELDSAQAHYNRGNALARQGQLEQALSAYQNALSLDPALEDAAHNKQVVEQLIQQQQEQEQDSGDGDPQDQQSESGDQPKQPQQGDQQDSDSQDSSDSQQNAEQQGSQGEQQDQQDQQTTEDDQQTAQEGDQGEEDSTDQQPTTPEGQAGEQEDTPPDALSAQNKPAEEGPDELEQARDQWLRRVPDDPGGLLREKFRQESRLRREHDMTGAPW